MSLAVRFVILSFVFLNLTVAQSPNGTISGIIHDPSDRAIPGAEIIVVNDATNIQYQTKTNDEGIYVVPDLPPGPYRIQVTKRGFKTLIKPGLILNVQDALSVSITLPLGAVTEVVTVQVSAPLINTTDASVSTVVDREASVSPRSARVRWIRTATASIALVRRVGRGNQSWARPFQRRPQQRRR
ncbi:MAG TPA: carboxypeptidase-like regulatory domain-containing protein [Candidatus Acidoferrum sp.]|nr:carboxypeptidase-like regulatory domain-containing protein [Candidatus Acidoferrum sp.]